MVREIDAASAKLQPMLVGTTSIEKSEQLGEMLEQHGYKKLDFSDPADALKPLYDAARAGQAVADLRDPERPLPRAGGLHRRRGRRARRDHHRHQHGRPRHRHSARRQRRDARAPGGRPERLARGARAQGGGDPRRSRRFEGAARSPPAASTSSAPSGTRAGASTTSCAAAPAARATPAAPSSSCRCRTI